MTIHLDMMLTMSAGIAALLLGLFLNKKVPVLRRICIPAPVTGGLIISLLTLLSFKIWGFQFSFDTTLKDVCMVMFFTTVGFQSDLTVLKKGGRLLVMMVVLVALLIVLQNLCGVSLARLLGKSPLIGMSAGSITMCGGHGTAAGFTELLESKGLEGAGTIMMATATFGVVAGSLIGGPLGEFLINRFKLSKENPGIVSSPLLTEIDNDRRDKHTLRGYTKATYEIFIAAGLGTLLNKLIALTGISFPTYLGALIVAALIRNVSEMVPACPKTAIHEITSIGTIALSLFLGIVMVSLRLWELAELALPLFVILMSQIVLIIVFSLFIAFPILGRDYDAAILVSGICGFGLGATPNAIANMSAVSNKYHYAVIPFLVVPVVGAMFVDIINIGVITIFLNLI